MPRRTKQIKANHPKELKLLACGLDTHETREGSYMAKFRKIISGERVYSGPRWNDTEDQKSSMRQAKVEK